jgi:hypothetical protein
MGRLETCLQSGLFIPADQVNTLCSRCRPPRGGEVGDSRTSRYRYLTPHRSTIRTRTVGLDPYAPEKKQQSPPMEEMLEIKLREAWAPTGFRFASLAASTAYRS